MKQNILIIEDEKEIRSILYELLTDAGYQVSLAGDGLEGLDCFHSGNFSLILLDIMMPKIDGYAVCELIRKESDIPVIMITAMDEEDAQVKAFELQADDYITKPFSLRLVLKRVEAILRRTSEKPACSNTLNFQEIVLDPSGRTVYVQSREIRLTHIEFDLLEIFMRYPGQVFTRESLITQVWGYDYTGDDKAVNIHIMNLRRKLGINCIRTIRGVGYKFESQN